MTEGLLGEGVDIRLQDQGVLAYAKKVVTTNIPHDDETRSTLPIETSSSLVSLR